MRFLQRSIGRDLGWAVYLACSWTWCIGMYLPVVLYREYGIGGWIIFAVPNVIGSAAMAWVVRDSQASQRIVCQHRPATVLFSLITIAFQCYFLGWLLELLPVSCAALGGFALILMFAFGLRGDTHGRQIAALVWLFSFGVLTYLLVDGRPLDQEILLASRHGAPLQDLIWLAPVCALGFLLCPYLDLTFHHVRQQTTPTGGRWAFGVGFGLLFLAMITLTLVYAPTMTWVFHGWWRRLDVPPTVVLAVMWHMLLQLGFTLVVHVGRLTSSTSFRDWRLPLAIIVCGAVPLAMPQFLVGITLLGMNGTEFMYRAFMGCYGLIAPAYVLICVVPSRVSREISLLVCFVAVLVASPAYALGFFAGQTWVLGPGLAMVLIGACLVHVLPRLLPARGVATNQTLVNAVERRPN